MPVRRQQSYKDHMPSDLRDLIAEVEASTTSGFKFTDPVWTVGRTDDRRAPTDVVDRAAPDASKTNGVNGNGAANGHAQPTRKDTIRGEAPAEDA